jgi:hypothetical protein
MKFGGMNRSVEGAVGRKKEHKREKREGKE